MMAAVIEVFPIKVVVYEYVDSNFPAVSDN